MSRDPAKVKNYMVNISMTSFLSYGSAIKNA